MSKVVLSPSPDGRTSLRISNLEPGNTEHSVIGHELHMGSQDLIRFADFASNRGFRISSFMLADPNLSPLIEDEQVEISRQMVELLSAYGGDELEAAMRDEFDGLYVVGVNLIASSSGRRISVRRRGYVETSIVQEAERLLQSAWRELHLS